jgi:hypothetical protein
MFLFYCATVLLLLVVNQYKYYDKNTFVHNMISQVSWGASSLLCLLGYLPGAY